MSKNGILGRTPGIFESQTTILSAKFGSQCVLVGENAFKNCTTLDTINDDNVIEIIGSNAFAGTNLRSVNLSKLKTLHQGAFSECSNLSYISMPMCSSIANGAFYSCSNLLSISIPSFYSRVTIERNAFRECVNLKSVDVNKTETIILNSAFYKCKNLSDINFDNCIAIGPEAFAYCESLDKITLNKCENIGDSAFLNCINLEKVYVNGSKYCKLDSPNAFYIYDASISKYSINNNIQFYFPIDTYEKYIHDYNWKHYSQNMIMMPKQNQIIYTTNDGNIIEIKDSELKNNTTNTYEKYGLIEFKNNSATFEQLNKKIFKGSDTLTSIDLPFKCESIGDSEFEDCINLTSVTPSSLNVLTHIGKYAFKNCVSLKSFKIPDSILSLDDAVFIGCKNIEKFEGNMATYNGKAIVSNEKLICVLPKDDSINEGRIHKISLIDSNIKYLGESCFYGCENMRRVDIPSSVKYIGNKVFEECKNLCEIHLEGSVPPVVGNDIFIGVRNDFKIFVPEGSLENYFKEWGEYAQHIYPKPRNNDIIYYGDTKLSNTHTFISSSETNGNYYKISNISNGTLPTNYFTNQSSVKKVILGDGIVKINQKAFRNCTNLEYIYLSDNITQFNDECFYGCESLTRIHIPIELKKYTYTQQGDKQSGTNSPTVTKDGFGDETFYGCKNLKEFGTYYKGYVSDDNRCYIHNNEIKFFAQGGLTNDEKEYKIPDNITLINKSAFRGSEITSISIGESTKTIGAYAFEGCEKLQSITNWDNVKSISTSTFKGCVSLGEISLPTNLEMINNNAFENCTNMYINTNIPDSVTIIGNYAFSGCTNFKYTGGELSLGKINSINTSTFYECSSLDKVYINANITNIGSSAFENCVGLTTISISKESQLNTINTNAFKGCVKLCSDNSAQKIYLPKLLKYIGNSAFEDCKNLDINISNESTLKSIGLKAFKNCTNLWTGSSKSLPNSIQTIGYEAFYGCEKILSISLPSGLQRIGDRCFKSPQTSLTISIPDDLKSPPVFINNSGLDDTAAMPFGDPENKKLSIFVPNNLKNAYALNKYWYKYKDDFK